MNTDTGAVKSTLRLMDIQKEAAFCKSRFRTLYEEAFPAIERKPLEMMELLAGQGKMELLAIVEVPAGVSGEAEAQNALSKTDNTLRSAVSGGAVENARFIGLAVNMMDGDTALLDYFAIAPEHRNGGYGSRSLALLLKRFRGKKYIFEIEMQDPSAENAADRKRRKAFYLRNGLKETWLFANVYGTDFEILTPDGSLTFQQYTEFLQTILGGLGIELLKPALIAQRGMPEDAAPDAVSGHTGVSPVGSAAPVSGHTDTSHTNSAAPVSGHTSAFHASSLVSPSGDAVGSPVASSNPSGNADTAHTVSSVSPDATDTSPASEKPVFHGSDIEKVCEIYHLNRKDIVNFGANVNPLGLSAAVKVQLADHLDLLSVYPDRQYTALRRTISEYCGIPTDFILPGNGSSELIALLIEEKAPRHTLILGPTYSEYSRELAFSGSTQEYYHLREEDNFILDTDDLCRTLASGYDFLILCNPNNPTSSALSQKGLREILRFCQERRIFVMIDETYVEFAPDIAAVTAVPLTMEFDNLMVLRGVSKFFAAPGMRLGYGITGNQKFLKKMREKQTPWSLNSLGAFAGELMLRDADYIQRTRELVLSERSRIEKELKAMPAYRTYPAYANFFLLRILKPGLTSADVFDACIRRVLMLRDCSSFQCLEGEFIRFCIMTPEANSRLLEVLKTL